MKHLRDFIVAVLLQLKLKSLPEAVLILSSMWSEEWLYAIVVFDAIVYWLDLLLLMPKAGGALVSFKLFLIC